MKFLHFLGLATWTAITSSLIGSEQTMCPMMIDAEIDIQEVVEYEGKEIYLCCSACLRAFKANPDYYVKIGIQKELLPQFDSMPENLESLELMQQRFCPIRNTSIVGPSSPSIEYNGKTVYFFKERDIRRWNRDPEGMFQKARSKGLLPQFDT